MAPIFEPFLTALYKLPSAKNTAWFGVRGNVSHLYKQEYIWQDISSYTRTMKVIEAVFGRSAERTRRSSSIFRFFTYDEKESKNRWKIRFRKTNHFSHISNVFTLKIHREMLSVM